MRDASEIGFYIDHRLNVAGYRERVCLRLRRCVPFSGVRASLSCVALNPCSRCLEKGALGWRSSYVRAAAKDTEGAFFALVLGLAMKVCLIRMLQDLDARQGTGQPGGAA